MARLRKGQESRNTPEGRAKDAEQARLLVGQGIDASKVALLIGRSREFVRTHAGKTSAYREPTYWKREKKLHYDWLPEDEEANVMGYYVPTPQELRVRMTEVRYGNYYKIAYLPYREKVPSLWSDHAMHESVAVERFRAEIGPKAVILNVSISPKVFDRD